jgi:hypothetical protein
MKKFKVLIEIYIILFLMIILWTSVTCIIQRFKCPQMTETQLFINIPNSFMTNWKYCNN